MIHLSDNVKLTGIRVDLICRMMTYTTQTSFNNLLIDLVEKLKLNAGGDELTGMLRLTYITTSHAVPLLA